LDIDRLRQRGEDHVDLACKRTRAVCPNSAGIDMMAGRLPMEVMNDEPEAGLLHVGCHPAAHRAQSDESHHYTFLGHLVTARFFQFFTSTVQASRRPAVAEDQPARKDALPA